jgi:2-hydroxychromene-2-carboxylate isomerase
VAPVSSQPVFYYDLGSPDCYLAAERSLAILPVVPEWEPVLGPEVQTDAPAPDRDALARRVLRAELQPLRWPPSWPPDTERAMLAATYAKHIGRAVAFSLAAFRQAFAGGRDLGDERTILLAAAACEIHPAAVLKGIGLRSVTTGLRAAGQRALAAGVTSLPAIQVGQALFQGAGAVEEAEAALSAVR